MYLFYYYYCYFNNSCSGSFDVVLVASVLGTTSIITRVGLALGAVTASVCNRRSTGICYIVGSTSSFPPTRFA